MNMSETSHLEKVTELVQNHATGAELSREHGREITYTLPLTAVDKFVGKLECIAGYIFVVKIIIVILSELVPATLDQLVDLQQKPLTVISGL